MAQTLTCPHCGAPLDYTGDAATIRCPYCETSVVVPAELRKHAAPAASEQPTTVVIPIDTPAIAQSAGCGIGGAILIGVFVLFILGIVGFVFWNNAQIDQANALIQSENKTEQARMRTQVAAQDAATAIPAPTRARTTAPTPGFGSVALKFGSEGTGPGYFNDARSIAVDNNGNVYVADYQGGRVQVFDSTGKYESQWQVGNSKTVIFDLAADRKGTVYVAADGDIIKYDAKTGKELGTLPNPGGDGYGNIALRADGNLLAMWYQSRFGIITTLEGHRDDMIRFDNQGKVLKTFQSFISGQTEDYAFDTQLAVDGLGNIFALDRETTGAVYRFTPEGKFVTRLLSRGDKPGQINSAYCLAIDGQGRFYVADSNGIEVFDTNAGYIGNFGLQARARAMMFDDQNRLWTVNNNQVVKYTLNAR